MAKKENSLKRTSENVQEAALVDVTTGKMLNIIVGEDFLIGRSRDSTLLIEESYISRVQCIIKYENNNFILYDQSSSSGTFLNCIRMLKKDSPHVLQHGDIVSFGDTQKIKYIYKFSLVTSPGKKLKSNDEKVMENLAKKNKQLKNDISKLDVTVTKLNEDYQNLKENVKTKICEFEQKITELISVTESHFKTLDRKKYNIDILKSQVHCQLEDNFQCSICNEIVLKATIGDCSHTFCDNCITTWLIKSKLCPVCRTPINSTYNTLAVDNFLSDFYDLLGGPMKEQREALLIERNIVTSDRVRPRSNLTRRQILPALQERTRSTIRYAPRLDSNRRIDFVDLT